jgi:UDP-N-acetylglucosamine:LPS N-acetylglucosamine transferase
LSVDLKAKRVLAIASGGGHWVQLRRIMRSTTDADITYVSTLASYRSEVGKAAFYTVQDASRWDRWKLIVMVLQVAWLVLRKRPDVVITTGAATGYVALRIGKLLGARTIWVDSIANVEELSLSGRKAGKRCAGRERWYG